VGAQKGTSVSSCNSFPSSPIGKVLFPQCWVNCIWLPHLGVPLISRWESVSSVDFRQDCGGQFKSSFLDHLDFQFTISPWGHRSWLWVWTWAQLSSVLHLLHLSGRGCCMVGCSLILRQIGIVFSSISLGFSLPEPNPGSVSPWGQETLLHSWGLCVLWPMLYNSQTQALKTHIKLTQSKSDLILLSSPMNLNLGVVSCGLHNSWGAFMLPGSPHLLCL
jgi:hypothetical protein